MSKSSDYLAEAAHSLASFFAERIDRKLKSKAYLRMTGDEYQDAVEMREALNNFCTTLKGGLPAPKKKPSERK